MFSTYAKFLLTVVVSFLYINATNSFSSAHASTITKTNCSDILSNPLLDNSTLENGAYLDFDKVKPEHFIPAIKAQQAKAEAIVNKIKKSKKATFRTVIMALEEASRIVTIPSTVFSYYGQSFYTPELDALKEEISKLNTDYSTRVYSDPVLFQKVKKVFEKRARLKPHQSRLVSDYYYGFIETGVNLKSTDQTRYREIVDELSRLSIAYSRNLKKYTAESAFVVENEEDLKGLNSYFIKTMRERALKKGLNGFLVTLDAPLVMDILENSENEDLQKKVWLLWNRRAYASGETDNSEVIKNISRLRHELAQLFGERSYADKILKTRMAQNLETVNKFAADLLAAYRPVAIENNNELIEFVKLKTGTDQFNPWRRGYWANQMIKEKYAFDENQMRDYLEFSSVRNGLFDVVRRLYGIEFVERQDLPKPHPDVVVYEVRDQNCKTNCAPYGYVLLDLFSREGKPAGAWMGQLFSSYLDKGSRQPAIVTVNLNITKPNDSDPILLSYSELQTFYHEFGHALHSVLTQTEYMSQSGANVAWDFVELPSQFMENFARHPELLKLYAKHNKTGAEMPQSLIEGAKRSEKLFVGSTGLRQIELILLDLAWNTDQALKIQGTISEIENELLKGVRIAPMNQDISYSTAFGHIFVGGYAAGYYSYRWSEVLDADAFSIFMAEGIFNPGTAERFRRSILEVGDTRDAMEAYIDFAGRRPNIDALLERDGIKK